MSLLSVAEARFGDVLGESGDEARFRCPYHDDDEGKLYVNVMTGLWICFSGHCGKKGKLGYANEDDEIDGLRSRVRRMNEEEEAPVERLPEGWLRQFQRGHTYWHTIRKFSSKTIERFDLGYDPASNRLTIPVRDTQGELLGAIYRSLDGSKPKYLHPKGFRTGHHLFGSHLVGDRRKVALVEGPLDAIACWDARVPALACYGARLTEGQHWLLNYLGVEVLVPMFDHDKAGARATEALNDEVDDLVIFPASWPANSTAKDPGELRPDQRRKVYHGAGL